MCLEPSPDCRKHKVLSFFLTAKRTIPLILGWKPMVTKVTRAASISIEFF
jgi:hypothetical protein